MDMQPLYTRTDRTLVYSFGPWRSLTHVLAMRESAEAREAFRKLHESCLEMTPPRLPGHLTRGCSSEGPRLTCSRWDKFAFCDFGYHPLGVFRQQIALLDE
jgi:hypothetical protein